MKLSRDTADLIFRALFCSIFVGLGGEHLFSDTLIRRLMPDWVPMPRLVSMMCGVWLVTWGGMLLLGWHVKTAAKALAVFLIIVTLVVHAPGVILHARNIPESDYWMWDILQRSNLVKNLCLLGVCLNLLYHDVGRYSLDWYFANQRALARPASPPEEEHTDGHGSHSNPLGS